MMYAYRMQQLLHSRYKRGVLTGRQKTLAEMDGLLDAVAETKAQMAALAAEAQAETLRAELRLVRERLRRCLMLDEAQRAERGHLLH